MSLPRYPEYKNSGIEWFKSIPEHWKVVRLKNILKNKITDGPHSTPSFIDDGIPFLSVDGIQNGELIFESCRYISPDDHAEFRKKACPVKNDLLMGKAASTGKIARVKVDFEFSIWSPLALIRIEQKNSTPEFIEYALKAPMTQAEIDILCTANTQKNISMDDIPKLTLFIPPISEQIVITEFLDQETAKIDRLITEQEKLIALLKEKRQTVISRTVTKGLKTDIKMKHSGAEWLGEIPEHWEAKPLKYLGEIISGFAFNSNDFTTSGIRVLKIANIQTNKIDWSDESYLPDEFLIKHSKFSVKNDDVVFALTRPIISTGLKAAVVDIEDDKVLLNQRNALFRPIDGVNKKFVYQVLFSDSFLVAFENKIDFTGQQPNISPIDIGDIKIPVPPMEEQIAIAEFLNSLAKKYDELSNEAERSINALKERRSALISAAVTGQIDVRNYKLKEAA